MIRLINDWREKHYQCVVCGTHKSVKYWVISNDGLLPVCNKCVLLVSSNCNGILNKIIPQKVKRDPFGVECPNCGGRIVLPSTYTFGGKMINIRCDYCYSCGQALDWSEEQ